MKIKHFIFLITMGLLCVTQAQNQNRQHTPKHQQAKIEQEENILQVEQLQQAVENKAFYNDYVDTLITYDTSLTPINRYTYTYNDEGDTLTNQTERYLSNAWQYQNKYTYTYDEAGNKLTRLYETLQSGTLKPYNQYTYTYDQAGNMLTQLYETLQSGTLKPYTQYTYTYDPAGNRLTELYENLQSGVLTPNRRTTYEYDSNSQLRTLSEHELFKNGSWELNSRYVYKYDENGNKVFESYEDFTLTGGSDFFNRRYTYVYNDSNKLLVELRETRKSNKLDSSTRYTYTYDENNNRLSYLTEQYNAGWMNQSQVTYTYDENNNELSYLYQTWKAGKWDTLYATFYTYDENSNQLSYTDASYDSGTGTWIINERFSYTYDEYGRNTSFQEEYDFDASGVSSDRYLNTYTYDENDNIITSLWEGFYNNVRTSSSYYTYAYDANKIVIGDTYENYDEHDVLKSNYRRTYTQNENGRYLTGMAEIKSGPSWIPYRTSLRDPRRHISSYNTYASYSISNIHFYEASYVTICERDTTHIVGNICQGDVFYFDGKELNTSGSYEAFYKNSEGCDSLVILNLTIIPLPDNSITQNDNILIANENDASYQWVDCNDNNTPIEGETNKSFVATKTGRYAVIVNKASCISTSDCYSVEVSGITNATFDKGISLYPNPTTDKITLDIHQIEEQTTAYIYNTQGVLVKEVNIDKHSQDISTSELNSGFYIIKIKTQNNSAVRSFVVQK